jgi:hypothetical protein
LTRRTGRRYLQHPGIVVGMIDGDKTEYYSYDVKSRQPLYRVIAGPSILDIQRYLASIKRREVKHNLTIESTWSFYYWCCQHLP